MLAIDPETGNVYVPQDGASTLLFIDRKKQTSEQLSVRKHPPPCRRRQVVRQAMQHDAPRGGRTPLTVPCVLLRPAMDVCCSRGGGHCGYVLAGPVPWTP